MECPDTDLLTHFRETGDQQFLNDLLDRHLSRIRGLVFQMVLDHAAADDVTQEIFLRVIRGIERFEGRSAFSTWLYTISMNCVRSYLQHSNRDRLFVDVAPETAITTRSDGGLLQAELKTEIQTALKQLTPTLRTAVVLVCLQQLSPDEAAQIENCSTKTMHWRVHEARKQLKHLLAEHMT